MRSFTNVQQNIKDDMTVLATLTDTTSINELTIPERALAYKAALLRCTAVRNKIKSHIAEMEKRQEDQRDPPLGHVAVKHQPYDEPTLCPGRMEYLPTRWQSCVCANT